MPPAGNQLTLFSTPIITPVVRWAALLLLRAMGWRATGGLGDVRKCVMIAAPHTTNWDGVIMCSIALRLRIPIRWMGKRSLFKPGLGWLLKWCGGISVDRENAGGLVGEAIAAFDRSDALVMTIAPEGTRKATTTWKSGFYRIAVGAGVPIALGFLDYRRKVGGIIEVFEPSGDIEVDLRQIRARYAGIEGKYPPSDVD